MKPPKIIKEEVTCFYFQVNFYLEKCEDSTQEVLETRGKLSMIIGTK